MSVVNLSLPRSTKKTNDFLKGQITAPKSLYKPSKEVKTRVSEILRKFQTSRELQNRSYEEFNNQSLTQISNELQKVFNNFREPKSENADERWKSNALRPIVRNRALSIAAHVTGTVVHPKVVAQNENQESDKQAATVMNDILEWANDQSDYVKTFLYAVIAAIVNPATCVHTEYSQVFKEYKEIDDDGKWEKKVKLDEILSGFRDTLVPLDEIFLADFYEPNIQKQPFLIWRRVIEYSTALSKYGDNDEFIKHVRPGVQNFFDNETDSFYEIFDEELQERLVEEVIYYDRNQDLQLTIVNGVLLDDPEQPIKRKDKLYPFIWGGYEVITQRFAYFFSLVRKMKDDAEIVNTLYRMIIDQGFLQTMPPANIFGDEIVSSSVVAPGAINTFKENTRLEPLNIGANLNSGLSVIEKVESSITESSNDFAQSGQNKDLPNTLGQQALLERNARIMLGLFGKMIADLVKQWGRLRVGDILQHLTVGEVHELLGDDAPLKYPTFLLPDKVEAGKKRGHRIELREEEEELSGFDVLALQGGAKREQLRDLGEEDREEFIKKGIESDTKLFIANPSIFRKRKYTAVVRAEAVIPPSDVLQKGLNLELYDRARTDPFAEGEAIYRELLLGSYDKTRDNQDRFVRKPEDVQAQQQGQPPQQQGSVLNKLFGGGRNQTMNAQAEQAKIK